MKLLVCLFFLIISLSACSLPSLKLLPHEKAEKVSTAISVATKDYCDQAKMKSCAYNILVKKAVEDVQTNNVEKAFIGSLACSTMAGIVVDALNEKTFIKQCGCDSSKIKSKVQPLAAGACAGLPF